jgi:hypothetical protein
MQKLRAAYHLTQGKMDLMARELADLKKGKVEMEAELETLSQALFEEANKMVADERRRRLELEESLKEVKDEREALRDTIKVLGGKVDAGGEKAAVDGEKKDEGEAKKEKVKEEDEVEDDWKPRDLDKHYEALRKTIHHVADGATGSGSGSPGAGAGMSGADALVAAVSADTTQRTTPSVGSDTQGASVGLGLHVGTGEPFEPVLVNPVLELSPVLPKTAVREEEVNPWAEVDFSGGGAGQGVGAGRRETGVDPLESDGTGIGMGAGEGEDDGPGGAVLDDVPAEGQTADVDESGRMRRSSTA